MSFPPVPSFHPEADPQAVVTAKNVRFTVLTDRLLRLEYSRDDVFEDRPSQAFWHRRQPVPSFRKTVTDSSIEIETDLPKNGVASCTKTCCKTGQRGDSSDVVDEVCFEGPGGVLFLKSIEMDYGPI